MGVKSKNQLKKQEVKSRQSVKAQKIQMRKEIASLSGIDKINYEISILEKQITSCKYDLENQFKGNQIIERKYQDLTQKLEDKKREKENAKALV